MFAQGLSPTRWLLNKKCNFLFSCHPISNIFGHMKYSPNFNMLLKLNIKNQIGIFA